MTKHWLLEFINRNGPVFSEDIAFKSGLSDSYARSALYRLLKQGLIRRLNDRWMLTARGLARLDYLKGKKHEKSTGISGILEDL